VAKRTPPGAKERELLGCPRGRKKEEKRFDTLASLSVKKSNRDSPGMMWSNNTGEGIGMKEDGINLKCHYTENAAHKRTYGIGEKGETVNALSLTTLRVTGSS